ncbi:MAG: hypothetical protein J5I81_00615 [Nitrococcus mobilis]|nr:hypothetical protein [Nitrococcus mobilis]
MTRRFRPSQRGIGDGTRNETHPFVRPNRLGAPDASRLRTKRRASTQGGLNSVGAKAPAQEDPALIERRWTGFNVQQLKPGEPAEVVLPLPEKTVRVKVSPVSAKKLELTREQSAWIGCTDDGSEFFIMGLGDGYEAQLGGHELIYRIRSVDGGPGMLEIYDAERFRAAPNDGVRGYPPAVPVATPPVRIRPVASMSWCSTLRRPAPAPAVWPT